MAFGASELAFLAHPELVPAGKVHPAVWSWEREISNIYSLTNGAPYRLLAESQDGQRVDGVASVSFDERVISNPRSLIDEGQGSNSASAPRGKAFGIIADAAHSDPDPTVRGIAQEEIKNLFPGGADEFDAVMRKFAAGLREVDNPQKQELAVIAFLGVGELAIPYLEALLKDPDPRVRAVAIKVLSRLEQEQRMFTGNIRR